MSLKLGLTVLALGLVWAYAPVLSAGFVYEDARWMDGCAMWAPHLVTRDLARASWCAQVGQSARAFHLVNVGLHLVNVGLVAALLWCLTADRLATWAGAVVFALHPLQTETVAYLAGGRPELIAACGVLLAALALVSGRWVLVPFAVVLALGGKESAIVLIALLPLLWCLTARRSAWPTLAAVVVLLTATALVSASRSFLASSGPWIAQQGIAFARLVSMVVVPIGQTVDFDYALTLPALALAAILVTGLLAVIVLTWRVRPLLAAGLAWMVIAVLPRFVVVTPLSVLNEHQFYLSMVGVSMAVASCMGEA